MTPVAPFRVLRELSRNLFCEGLPNLQFHQLTWRAMRYKWLQTLKFAPKLVSRQKHDLCRLSGPAAAVGSYEASPRFSGDFWAFREIFWVALPNKGTLSIL